MQTFIIFWCGVFISWLGLVGCLLKKRMKEINDPWISLLQKEKRQKMMVVIVLRVRSRFFDQVGHETMHIY